jgi:hypothetical protein
MLKRVFFGACTYRESDTIRNALRSQAVQLCTAKCAKLRFEVADMVFRMDVLMGMSRLPFFSQGESQILAALERRSPYRHGGVMQQWALYEGVWKDVMEYLRSNYVTLSERDRWRCCQLRTSKLREMIQANEREYECYRALVTLHTA